MEKVDEFGPEMIVEVYDQKSGMHGVTVIHNTALGPGKGGIRMVPDITVEEVIGLAAAMTWKNALAGIPFGGAKSGILADPKTVDKEAVMRSFARRIAKLVPDVYIPGPDMNTTEKEMGYIADELHSRKASTGKPESMGGLPHELGSTGFGVSHATRVGLEHIGSKVAGATVAIEGFGNVGTFTAKFLSAWGAKIVAVSDSKGVAYLEGGLDYEMLMKAKATKGTVTAYPGCKVLPGQDLFGMKVDVLIPGARPNVINESNMSAIRARMIVEAANIPIKPAVEAEIEKRGILIVPDIIANAGGVISSFVEHIGGTEEEMFQMVEEKIVSNTRLVLRESERIGNTREAAMKIAKERVKHAMLTKKY
jgi:glutamate dehydrogenase (NAD(P)+)